MNLFTNFEEITHVLFWIEQLCPKLQNFATVKKIVISNIRHSTPITTCDNDLSN